MTVTMALVDYVPVLLFGVCAAMLRRNQYEKMSKEIFALLGSGTMMILTAGLFKATWKLLYTGLSPCPITCKVGSERLSSFSESIGLQHFSLILRGGEKP